MDKYLRPERLAIDPSSTTAEEDYTHWKQTFINFITALETNEESGLADAVKVSILTNFLSPSVYRIVKDKQDYTSSIQQLDDMYIKPKNKIYARYCLATRRQNPGETVDQYLQALVILGKECSFEAVSAVQNMEDYIRDSFIAGLSSSAIRQRLLENITLSLSQATEQARALELAQVHAQNYSRSFSAATEAETEPDEGPTMAAIPAKWLCYFCGGKKRHPRSQCPATGEECGNCGKIGHLTSVCKSKNKRNSKKVASTSSLGAISAASATQQKAVVLVRINDIHCSALVDTLTTTSFIKYALVDKCNARVSPSKEQMTMASSALSSTVEGSCTVMVDMLGHIYKDATLLIMKNLCADVIIGHDLLAAHVSLEMKLGGSKAPLQICVLEAANVPPVSLFTKKSDQGV